MLMVSGGARGVGSARAGVEHWKLQRLTALAGVLLGLWFIVSAVGLSGADQPTAAAWLGRPLNATLMLLLILAMFWHAKLGLQVIIEDYVQHEGAKLALLVATIFATFLLGGLSAVAVLKVALGS
jgi:succinate dehydrogenase / fumarate reductase, membrane anchor subunit